MPLNSTATPDEKRSELRQQALEYHEFPTPGKVAIHATKQLLNQHDLALAYSPGVAAPCEEIVKDPNNAFKYTPGATWSRSSRMARRCWAWATSARSHRSR